MYCWKCGKEMEEDARFCRNCGAEQNPRKEEVNGQENIEIEENAGIEQANKREAGQERENEVFPDLSEVVGKNQGYYLPEFDRIRMGEKPKFNWAAFLLMPCLLLYRRSWNLFKMNALIPYCLEFVSLLLLLFGFAGSFGMMIAGVVLAIASSVLLLVLAIRMGKLFNRFYFEQCMDRYKRNDKKYYGVSGKNIILFVVISVAVSIAVSMFSTMFSAWLLFGRLTEFEDNTGEYGTVAMEEMAEETPIEPEEITEEEPKPVIEEPSTGEIETQTEEEKGEFRPVEYSSKYRGITGFYLTKEKASDYFVQNYDSLSSFDTLDEFIDFKYGNIIYDFYTYTDRDMDTTEVQISFRDDYGWSYEDWEHIFLDILAASSMIPSAQTYFVSATFDFYNGSSLYFDSSDYYLD